MPKLTLPVDSQARKDIPVKAGCYEYFPAALVGVARWSKLGNDKHNPGEPMHHARGKSMDHEECVARHSMDLADLLAAETRGEGDQTQAILDELDARAWRALAASQEFREARGLAPLAPRARLPVIAPPREVGVIVRDSGDRMFLGISGPISWAMTPECARQFDSEKEALTHIKQYELVATGEFEFLPAELPGPDTV